MRCSRPHFLGGTSSSNNRRWCPFTLLGSPQLSGKKGMYPVDDVALNLHTVVSLLARFRRHWAHWKVWRTCIFTRTNSEVDFSSPTDRCGLILSTVLFSYTYLFFVSLHNRSSRFDIFNTIFLPFLPGKIGTGTFCADPSELPRLPYSFVGQWIDFVL